MNVDFTGMWFPGEAPVQTWYSKHLQMLGACLILRISYPELLSSYFSVYLKPSTAGKQLLLFYKHVAYKHVLTVALLKKKNILDEQNKM